MLPLNLSFMTPLNGIVLAFTFGCAIYPAIYLYRFSFQRPKPCFPIITLLITAVTFLITGLEFVFPKLLFEFWRNRKALLAGEWWRIVTPLFVQVTGWQCLVNGVGVIVFCHLTERLYGRRLLALYFIPGVLGEIISYLWHPNWLGAGSSLGIAGVVGSLFAFIFLRGREVSPLALIFAALGCAGAVALCFYRDNHGPSILIGVLLASMMTKLWPDTALEACEKNNV